MNCLKQLVVSDKYFKQKGDKAIAPKIYLRGGISEIENSNSTKYWIMSAEKYVKEAVANIEEKLVKSEM